MKELMINEDFSDVTLVTEDKIQIKANINILSACSPVFKDILKKDKNSISGNFFIKRVDCKNIANFQQEAFRIDNMPRQLSLKRLRQSQV